MTKNNYFVAGLRLNLIQLLGLEVYRTFVVFGWTKFGCDVSFVLVTRKEEIKK